MTVYMFSTALPSSSLIVLITAKKVSEKAPLFNFEAVYQKYRYYGQQWAKSLSASLVDMSR